MGVGEGEQPIGMVEHEAIRRGAQIDPFQAALADEHLAVLEHGAAVIGIVAQQVDTHRGAEGDRRPGRRLGRRPGQGRQRACAQPGAQASQDELPPAHRGLPRGTNRYGPPQPGRRNTTEIGAKAAGSGFALWHT